MRLVWRKKLGGVNLFARLFDMHAAKAMVREKRSEGGRSIEGAGSVSQYNSARKESSTKKTRWKKLRAFRLGNWDRT